MLDSMQCCRLRIPPSDDPDFSSDKFMTNHLNITGLTLSTCENLTNSFVCQIDSVKISQQESEHKTLLPG